MDLLAVECSSCNWKFVVLCFIEASLKQSCFKGSLWSLLPFFWVRLSCFSFWLQSNAHNSTTQCHLVLLRRLHWEEWKHVRENQKKQPKARQRADFLLICHYLLRMLITILHRTFSGGYYLHLRTLKHLKSLSRPWISWYLVSRTTSPQSSRTWKSQ